MSESESSVDGMPKRPKPREWLAYIVDGEIVRAHRLSVFPSAEDYEELVLLQEVIRG